MYKNIQKKLNQKFETYKSTRKQPRPTSNYRNFTRVNVNHANPITPKQILHTLEYTASTPYALVTSDNIKIEWECYPSQEHSSNIRLKTSSPQPQ